jgi:dienelactone hydrolase
MRIEFFTLVLLIGPLVAAGHGADKKRDVLPAPTGKLAIGRTTFYWTDNARDEPATEDPQDKRELRVDVWYPAAADAMAPKAAYCPDLAAIKSRLGLEAVAMGNIETHTLVDPPLAKSQPRYPVILFSPGLGNNGVYYTALVEELVSHGYVVATLDHPFQSAAIAYPDGRLVGVQQPNKELLASGDREQIYQEYRSRVAVRADDLRFVLDQFTRLNAGGLDDRFADRLDLDRVGVIGHSIGGVAAPEACMRDARFKAAVNMDGHANSLAILPDEHGAGPRQPLLELTDAPSAKPPTDQQLAQWKITRADFERNVETQAQRANDLMRTIGGGSYRVTIPGATHQSFSDTVLWVAADPKPHHRRVQIMRDYVRALFDKHLRGSADTILDAPQGPYEDVSVERFQPAK